MDFYTWIANNVDDGCIARPSASLNSVKSAACIFSKSTEKQPNRVLSLYLDNGCVYEANLTPETSSTTAKTNGISNDGISESEDFSRRYSPRVFTPLARFHVDSIYCGYDLFAVVTNGHVYMWGRSDKGQCGTIQHVVANPRRVVIKKAEILCEHGVREEGGEVSAKSLAFSKTLSTALDSDGSLWCWGALSSSDQPQCDPDRVAGLYGKRVLSVACGEAHCLALVAEERASDDEGKLPSSTQTIATCSKCRENRLQSSMDRRFSIDFQENGDFCPLGLKLQLSDGNSSPPIKTGTSAGMAEYSTYFFGLFSSSRKFSLSVNNKRQETVTLPVGVNLRDGEAYEMRKTKSTAGARFSFTSFDYNPTESGSSSDGNELDEHRTNVSHSSVNSTDAKSVEMQVGCFTAAEVWSWGDNRFGQLGLDDTQFRREPCRIRKLESLCIVKIDCGRYHSIALTSCGEAFVWGSNASGQIKQANIDVQLSPVAMKENFLIEVGSQSSVLDCSTGSDFTILLVNAINYNPEVYYCGKNFCQQVNGNENANANIAVRLPTINKYFWPTFVDCYGEHAIFAGRNSHRSPFIQEILELLLTEIKFSYVLKNLRNFVVALCSYNMATRIEESTVLKSYCTRLYDYFIVVSSVIAVIKRGLCECPDPALPSRFFAISSSTTYVDALKHLHFVYCQLLSSNSFAVLGLSSSLEDTLHELSTYNDVESTKQSSLLKKLLYVPFKRLAKYRDIANSILKHAIEPSDHDQIVQFIKSNKMLEQLISDQNEKAENTNRYWIKNDGKAHTSNLKYPGRILVKEFQKSSGVSAVQENGMSVQWNSVLIFMDAVAVVLKSSNRLLPFPLVWLVPISGNTKFLIQILVPEAVWTVEFQNGDSKREFIQCCNNAMMKHQDGPYSEVSVGVAPPHRRQAKYEFTRKHAVYSDAIYDGCWVMGKPHGRGTMRWGCEKMFRGKFKEGLLHGFGELHTSTSSNGFNVTKAHWREGRLSGLAVIEYANGNYYEGYLENGFRSGHGVLKQRNVLYIGAWHKDMRHGYGVIDRGKDKYLGMWENDVECGLGTSVTLEGDYCEGVFDKGVFLNGKLICDGTRYEGEFNGVGVLNGKSTITFVNGDTVQGVMSGVINDSVKITNASYRRNTAPPVVDTLTDSFATDEESVLPADQKWTDIFDHIYDSLHIDQRNDLADCAKVWEHLVSILERMKAFFSSSSSSVDSSIEKIPDWNGPLDAAYIDTAYGYILKAFAVPHHPLGRLLAGLADVFNACYSGVGAHPKLLIHAVWEIHSLVKRVYRLIKYLFPKLPQETDMNNLFEMERRRNGTFRKINDFETYGSPFYGALLELIYPNLFTMYVLRNEALDRAYWTKITNLNLKSDVALLDCLGVSKDFWPIVLSETAVLDAPMILATARKKYYADAIECLQRLSSESYPPAKLQIMVETFSNINQCVVRANSDANDQRTWTADTLVPVTTFVIVRAQIQRLGAELQLTESFCPQLPLLEEVQYMFATLQVCYRHIVLNKSFS